MTIVKNIPIQGSAGRWMATDIFYDEQKQNCPLVIYIHGFNGFKDWGNFDLIAHQFTDAGFVFIKMNLSHNGTSLESPIDFVDLEAFGDNNYTKELFDVQQIINWVANETFAYRPFVDINKIVLLGHSRGGGIAILKAAEDNRVKMLLCWASISECKTPWGNMSNDKIERWRNEGVMYYTNKRTNQKLPLYYQLYEDFYNNQNRLNIQGAIQHLSIPILLCHGKQDLAVDVSNAYQLKRWQTKAELFLIDGDHVFGRSHPYVGDTLPASMQQVVDKSLLFLNKNLMK